MWKCKYCGQVVDNKQDECFNCGTGRNWSPPTDAQLSAASDDGMLTTQAANNTGPIPEVITGFLRVMGIAAAVIGLIAGLLVLMDAPAAPGRTLPYGDAPQNPIRTLYLVFGWAQIIGGLTAGALLYAVAGIGDAVRDLWKAQRKR
jgi:hypothetical protein